MMNTRQVYKTRAAAFREYIRPLGLGISERTFYGHVDAKGMLQPDKSILLADLVAYVHREFPQQQRSAGISVDDAATRKAIAEATISECKAKRALEEEDLITRLKEKVAENEVQRAALVGLIYDTIKHHLHLEERRILHAVGADPNRSAELAHALEEVVDVAFNEVAVAKTVEVAFGE